jgi:hypothetical protein
MKKSELALLFGYSIFTFVGILNHEIWLDEAHHWLLARDSASIMELITNMKYDGHPALWNILLFTITRFTHNPVWMQVIHGLISISATYFFVAYSPFRFLQKAIFLFGYFVLYEYSIISRNYSLLLLLLFALTAIISRPQRQFLLIGFLLAILVNVHLFGCFISISIMLYVLLTEYGKLGGRVLRKDILIGVLLFCLGLVLSVMQIFPPEDSPFISMYDKATFFDRMETVLSGFIKAFVPIPDFLNQHFWNSNFLIVYAKPLAAIITVLLVFLPALLLVHRPFEMIFFYVAVSGILFFIYTAGIASQRYFGLLYIVFIQALWLSKSNRVPQGLFNMKRIPFFFPETIRSTITSTLFFVQMVAGLITYALDLSKPFSSGREVAEFLKSDFGNNVDLITSHVAFPSLCAYTQKKMYVLKDEKLESFIHWNKGFSTLPAENEIIAKAMNYKLHSPRIVLLITDREMNLPYAFKDQIQFIRKIGPGVIRTEMFYIYKVKS